MADVTLALGEDSLGCAASPSIDLLEKPPPPSSGLSGPAPPSPLEGGGGLSSRSMQCNAMDGDVSHTRLSSPGARVTSAKSTYMALKSPQLTEDYF